MTYNIRPFSSRQPIYITGVSCEEIILKFNIFLLSVRRRSIRWCYYVYLLRKTWEMPLSCVSCPVLNCFLKILILLVVLCRIVQSLNKCGVLFTYSPNGVNYSECWTSVWRPFIMNKSRFFPIAKGVSSIRTLILLCFLRVHEYIIISISFQRLLRLVSVVFLLRTLRLCTRWSEGQWSGSCSGEG